MKKMVRLHVRMESDLKDAFDQACVSAGIVPAEAIRELVVAATAYMQEHKKLGSFCLVPDFNVAEKAVECIMGKLLGADDARVVLHELIERERSRRLVADGERPAFGEAGADKRTHVITPPPARTAVYRRARSTADGAEVKRP